MIDKHGLMPDIAAFLSSYMPSMDQILSRSREDSRYRAGANDRHLPPILREVQMQLSLKEYEGRFGDGGLVYRNLGSNVIVERGRHSTEIDQLGIILDEGNEFPVIFECKQIGRNNLRNSLSGERIRRQAQLVGGQYGGICGYVLYINPELASQDYYLRETRGLGVMIAPHSTTTRDFEDQVARLATTNKFITSN